MHHSRHRVFLYCLLQTVFSCFYHRNSFVFLNTQVSTILAHASHWRRKRPTITEDHDVVLHIDNGNPGPLRILHIMLTCTDMIA